jgi:hypothetical protein
MFYAGPNNYSLGASHLLKPPTEAQIAALPFPDQRQMATQLKNFLGKKRLCNEQGIKAFLKRGMFGE